MLRLLLITLMLLQPLQWAWAAVHVTFEAAHAVSHPHSEKTIPSIESIAACSLMGDVDHGQSCHDNHTHNTTVLGLGADVDQVRPPDSGGRISPVKGWVFTSSVVSDIERPKWVATR